MIIELEYEITDDFRYDDLHKRLDLVEEIYPDLELIIHIEIENDVLYIQIEKDYFVVIVTILGSPDRVSW